MLHEYLHTYQSRGLNPTAMADEEGEAYGVEYFFALRFSKTQRSQRIMRLQHSPLAGYEISDLPWDDFDTSRYRFCEFFLMLRWCYEVVDGKRQGATPDEARDAIVALFDRGEPSFYHLDSAGRAARAWAEQQIPEPRVRILRPVEIRDTYAVL